ncbi:uncharacterized protein LOC109713982 [Ananas comosus]|uniref:Uncharacterized protein LOC109713982 n=1 Tax=Ananas comosus TaxID=4615 RepID=A0A6P5FE76_ANACO|nr:uncharacterized protein LOC109713982 [Ananas comosus]
MPTASIPAPPLRTLPYNLRLFEPSPTTASSIPPLPLRSFLRLFDLSHTFSRAPLSSPSSPVAPQGAEVLQIHTELSQISFRSARIFFSSSPSPSRDRSKELAGPRALSRALAPCSMKCRGDCRALRGHRRGSLCLPAGCRLFVFLHSPYLECYMIATIELPPAFIPNYNAPFLECEMIAIIGPTFLATMKSSLAPIMKRTTELLGIKGTGNDALSLFSLNNGSFELSFFSSWYL